MRHSFVFVIFFLVSFSVSYSDEPQKKENSGTWLYPTPPVSAASVKDSQNEFRFTIKNSNVRDEPSKEGRIQYTLPRGTKVQVFETKNGWSKISVEDKEGVGYIFADLLSKDKPPESRRVKTKTEQERITGDLKLICDTLQTKGFISDYRLEFVPPPTSKHCLALTLTSVYGQSGFSRRSDLLDTITTFIRAKTNMPIRYYNHHDEVIAGVATGSTMVVYN